MTNRLPPKPRPPRPRKLETVMAAVLGVSLGALVAGLFKGKDDEPIR